MALIRITSFAKAKNNGSVGGSTSTTKGFTTTIKRELDTHYLWGQPFNGTQDVNGEMNIEGNVNVNGNIYSDGEISTSSNLHVGGKMDVEGDLNVEGYLDVTKNIHTKEDIHVEKCVYSTNIDTGTIQAKNGSITTVNSTNTNTTNVNATNGDIETLITQNAEIQNLNVDVLNAKQAHFWELIIDKMRSTNGSFILSPANAKIEKVVQNSDLKQLYQLMWRATDINTNKAITNDFEVNDQIICMSFNQADVNNSYNVNNKYYWAKVTSKGTTTAYDDLRETMCDWHYITLDSTQEAWDGTLNPEVGDEICVLGNTTDTTRQNAIILSSVNNTFLNEDLEAPSIAQYKGIKTFELKPYRLNCLSGNENTFYGNFNVIVGNTTSDVKDLINDSKSNIASIQTDSLVTFIMADSNGKIDSINAATGLVKKIEVYLGNDLIPTSEFDTSCYVQWRNAKFYPISNTGNKLREGIDINSFTVNTTNIGVNWIYTNPEETILETTPTDTEFVIYIKFNHNGTSYEKMFTVPATVIKTEKGTDAELDKLVVDSFKAVVTIKDKLEISGTAYILHIKGNTTTRVADLTEYTLDCVSDAGDKFNFNKSNYFFYRNDNYITNYSSQSKPQKIYTVRLFKGLNKVDELSFSVTFDSGAIFQVKADAITSAVQSSKTYTDGQITTVSNNVSRIEQTANEISSRVTAIENDYATNTELTQTANQISSRVTEIENDYVTSSELTQTANNVQINIYDDLNNKTGIDVRNGQITLDADNTTIVGNLNITDTDNGLTVYDSDGVPRINLQPKQITDFTDDIQDTIISHISTYNNANPTKWKATSDSYSISLTKGDTLEIRRITATMYARNTASTVQSTVYPSGGESGIMYGTLTVTKPDNSTKTYNLVMQGKGNGRFQQTKETLIADFDGTYKFVFNVYTNDTFQTTYKYLYCTFSCSFEIAQVRQTYVGTDGMFAHTGASKQVVFDEDETLLQFGANGIRWKEKIVNGNAITGNREMDVAVGYNNTNPTSVIWIPFYNYTPIFNPSNWIKGNIINTGNTNKYYYKIDVQNDRGICVVNYPPTNTSGRVQDAWILLPNQVIDDGNGNVGYYLPIGYTVTIINHTFLSALKCNLYVTGDASQKNGVVIIDSDRNYNYYCDLSGTQSSDTYIYMGTYNNSITGINTMFWQALHNTQ